MLLTLHIWGAGLLAIIARNEQSQRVCVPMSRANEHNVFVIPVLGFQSSFESCFWGVGAGDGGGEGALSIVGMSALFLIVRGSLSIIVLT